MKIKQAPGGKVPGEDRAGHLPAMDRRNFVKLGATGALGALSGCVASGGVQPDAAGAALTAPEGSAIPEVGDLPDPAMAPAETWQEPWLWRPEQWPGEALELNVVAGQNPGVSPSPGNSVASLFSYNGISPGPTVRVRNDGELRIRVRNTLGLNQQQVPVGPAPDPVEFTPPVRREICALVERQVRGGDPENPERCAPPFFWEQMFQVVPHRVVPGWNTGGHVNGLHGSRTTNLHTHGLHVPPQVNPDGSHSDNIFLRIIPRADFEARKQAAGGADDVLMANEHVGRLDYRLDLARTHAGERRPHPPGTHWYHPHSHGSTHDQVASGMAGYLIVEGDVDEAVNMVLTGTAWPEPDQRSGPWDYRERLMFLQRVFVAALDPGAQPNRKDLQFPPSAAGGERVPPIIRMRPGAVERWRVLNGSVDGAGTKRFMVLDGQYTFRDERIWRVVSEGEGEERRRRLEPVTPAELDAAKLDLHQLSLDGITLVREENGRARHVIRDLSRQNAGTRNPFVVNPRPGESEASAKVRAVDECFRDGDSLRRAFVRPNEVYLTNANRCDLLFQAPLDADGRVFTVLAAEAHIHNDTFQGFFQRKVFDPEARPFRPQFDVVVAWVHVAGEPVEGGEFDFRALEARLPPVPPLLQPIAASELEVPAAEARITGVPPGAHRTRTLSYSGTGGADWPVIEVPDGFAERQPEMENILWVDVDGVRVLMPNLTRTMAIHPDFDLRHNPDPGPPRKFQYDDPQRPRMLLDSAEEWVVYNCSQTLWSHTDLERYPQPGSWRDHYVSYPVARAEGRRRHARDPEFRITGKGTDHPFHIHVNPMWVLRIDVPDENGQSHNILPEPTWMDTVPVPRNGGRVVFRTRFDDFPGKWINHCHLLLHEDMGMMQMVECQAGAEGVNYHPRERVATHAMGAADVDAIYPPPSPGLMYRQNLSFVDPNELGYQEYPGFGLQVPVLDED